MGKFVKSFWRFITPFFPWLGLGFLLIYSFYYFVLTPPLGFSFTATNGEVWKVTSPVLANHLRPGDRVIQIGDLSVSDFLQEKSRIFLPDAQTGDLVKVVVQRGDQLIQTSYPLPEVSRGDILDKLNSQWFLPYIFWLAGTATFFFIRPKDKFRALLASFYFLTAGWIAMGIVSSSHLLASAILMRVFIWLWVPVTLHLHWIFPQPFKKFPKGMFIFLYTLGVLLAIAEIFNFVPNNLYYAGFLFAIIGSFILLVIHYARQVSERKNLFALVFALGIILIPLVSIGILGLLHLSPLFAGPATLGVSAFPGFYFYSIYQRQMASKQKQVTRLLNLFLGLVIIGTLFSFLASILSAYIQILDYVPLLSVLASISLTTIGAAGFAPFLILPALAEQDVQIFQGINSPRLSANRVLSFLLYTLLWIPATALIHAIILILFPGSPGNIFEAVFIGLLAVGVTILVFPVFSRLIDQKVLGIPINPDELIHTFSERIATRFNWQDLSTVLTEQVLPTLLIRQSALVWFDLKTSPIWVSTYGVTQEQLPQESLLTDLYVQTREKEAFTDPHRTYSSPLDWVKLTLLLRVNGEIQGLWWLGKRDPDDHYGSTDITVLNTLASQTAIALINIQQAKTLRHLYATSVLDREMERSHLARELHDSTLNEIATMGFYIDGEKNQKLSTIQMKLVKSLRQTINDLRPPMIDYGIGAALKQLVEDLQIRVGKYPQIEIELAGSEIRYSDEVEQQVYRIVQQALENSVHHASAAHLKISGSLSSDSFSLSILDDGMGFEIGDTSDLSNLLYSHHYGLIGMLERAAMIDAILHIDSRIGAGTRITVSKDHR